MNMLSKKAKLTYGFLIALIISVILVVWLQPRIIFMRFSRRDHGRHKDSFIQELDTKLKISTDQKWKLDHQRESSMKEDRVLFDQLRQYQEDLREELQQTVLDEKKIRSIHKRIKEIMDAMEDNKLKNVYELRAILSPEQFKLLRKELDNMFRNKKADPFMHEEMPPPDEGHFDPMTDFGPGPHDDCFHCDKRRPMP